MNSTDKSLRLKIRFVSRDLVPSDRATCTISSRVNFFDTKMLSDFEFGDGGCVASYAINVNQYSI